MMAKFEQPIPLEDGRTAGIYPTMDRPYRMACCDCGLVHNVEFSVVRETERFPNGTFEVEPVADDSLRIEMIVSRNNRSSGQIRRHMRTNNQ